MPKFNVQYVHVEETTYNEWVEAKSEQDAIDIVENNPSMNQRDVTDVQGIETKDFRVINTESNGPGTNGCIGG